MGTTFLLAKTLLLRVFRDPMTLLVLFAIPILLIVIFGAFLGSTKDIRIKTAVVNNSDESFARQIQASLKDVSILNQPEEDMTLAEAKKELKDKNIAGIVELPKGFGAVDDDMPSGKVRVHYNDSDATTRDILSGVVGSVVDTTNNMITGKHPPVSMEMVAISGGASDTQTFDGLFAMFSAMGIMMVGVFGVASTIPYDKKAGVLRRLRATPLKSSQLAGGIMLTYAVVGIVAISLMTIIAVFGFDLSMKGSWLDYSLFVLIALIIMLGFGMAIGGLAKNTTQSDMYGQIVFLSSLALSGIWIPRVLMPDVLQSITNFTPLNPIIDGIRAITVEGVSLIGLLPELGILGAWAVIAYVAAVKLFRWE